MAKKMAHILKAKYLQQFEQRRRLMEEDRPTEERLWWQDIDRPTMLLIRQLHTEHFKPEDQKQRE